MRIIKSYKVFESKESVESICQKYGIRNWTLNPDGTVDVDDNVNLSDRGLGELPLKFGRVTGYFDCRNNNLTSLEGSPNWVGNYFWCSRNKLTNLEGSPNWVGGSFDCQYNKLTSLVGGPNWVGGNFDCSFNKLTSLEGCPERVYGDLNCGDNKIHSLEYYPTILTGRLWTVGNPIDEIWKYVRISKHNNHGVLLELFWLNNPVRYENGEWVCYREFLDNFFKEIGVPNREFLDNFFKEIGVPSPPKLKKYKEV